MDTASTAAAGRALRLTYSALVARLADAEPRYGYISAAQLPPIDDDDIGVVLAIEPDLATGVFGALNTPQLIQILRARGADLTQRTVRLGAYLSLQLCVVAREHLLEVVQEECGRRRGERDARRCGVISRLEAAAEFGVVDLVR